MRTVQGQVTQLRADYPLEYNLHTNEKSTRNRNLCTSTYSITVQQTVALNRAGICPNRLKARRTAQTTVG
jgi:hypothetical protein